MAAAASIDDPLIKRWRLCSIKSQSYEYLATRWRLLWWQDFECIMFSQSYEYLATRWRLLWWQDFECIMFSQSYEYLATRWRLLWWQDFECIMFYMHTLCIMRIEQSGYTFDH